MAGLLDVILGYDCNLACDYCTITPAMRRRSLSHAQLLTALRSGRADDYDTLSLTGGEPTIRPGLLGLVRGARRLGYRAIKLCSNGLLYAAPGNAARLADAGVERFHISVHTHRAERYDTLVRREGSYSLMCAGLDAVLAIPAELVVDLIVKADTYRDLPDAIDWLRARGVAAVDLWFVSLTDHNAANVDSLPPMSQAVVAMREAFARGRAHGMRVRSLHVPRCLLGDDHPHAHDPGAARVRVVTPDATFELRHSRITGQRKVDACRGCRWESRCPGVRDDYLDRFGDVEIAAVRGQAPTRFGQVGRSLPVVR